MRCSAVASVSETVFGWNLGSVSKKVMRKPMLYIQLVHLPKSLIEDTKSRDRNPCSLMGGYMVELFEAGRKDRKQRGERTVFVTILMEHLISNGNCTWF